MATPQKQEHGGKTPPAAAAAESAGLFQPVFPGTTPLCVPIPPGSDEGQAQGGGRGEEAPFLVVEDSSACRPDASATPSPSNLTFLCLPGLGDVRQSYRFLAPLLAQQGHRLLVADIRGHGDSSPSFPSYTPLDISSDIAHILHAAHVLDHVVLVANSLSASSALHYAALHPEKVVAVVGLGPVVRDLPADSNIFLLTYVLFQHPWGVPLWLYFYGTLFKDHKPQDLEQYKLAMGAKLREKWRLAALAQLARGSKKPCFQEAGRVVCPVLLVHGEKDPDFPDPKAEGEEVKAALKAAKEVDVQVMQGLGHYPHVEQPPECAAHIKYFVDRALSLK